MAELKSEFLYEQSVDLEEPLDLGETPHGRRHIYHAKGGSFEGPKLKGDVLPGGGDWFLLRPDGAGELDVRVIFRTDDGHTIYVYYRGILHIPREVARRIFRGESANPSEYYFRTTPCFETASEKYGWLNRIVAVGVGKVAPNWVGFTVHAIL